MSEYDKALARAHERARRLAQDKSALQLVLQLIGRLGDAPGLESTIDDTLRNVVDVIGGTNIELYYQLDGRLLYADVYGERRALAALDHPWVREVWEQREAHEHVHDVRDTLAQVPLSTQAYTWVFPLEVGADLVGVLKLNALSLNMRPLYKHLQPFMRYAALLLRNEIIGYERLARANAELRELTEQLEARVAARTREVLESKDRLQASEARYLDLYHEAPDMYVSVDVTNDIVLDCNETTARRLGYARAELLGSPFHALYDPSSLPAIVATQMSFRSTGDVRDVDMRMRRQDGSCFDVSLNATAVRDGDGHITVARAILRDITTQKRAEAALRASERRFRAVFDGAPLGIAVIDIADPGGVSLNRRMCEIFGCDDPDRVHRIVRDAAISADNKSCATADFVNERQYARADGSDLWVAERVATLDEPGAPEGLRVVLFEDTTARHLLERERSRLIGAMEHTGEAVVITDRDARILYVNPAFEHVTGYTKGEVLGRTPSFLHSGVHDRAFYEAMRATLNAGLVWTGHLVNQTKAGQRVDEDVTISPVFDPRSREIVSFVAVERDVTAKLAMEQRLRQNQKLEAMGTLAGGIAHDFNNILTAIMGFGELVLMELPANSDARTCQLEAMQAGRRASELVRQILTFSRQSPEVHVVVNVPEVLNEALKLLRASIPATIAFDLAIDPACASILADPTQLHQVVMNLATNAYHAMREGGGVLSLALREERIDELPTASRSTPLPPGRYLRLEVRDTGHGMDAATMERAFEPYFTTKLAGDGTGLGLSLVHSIVTGMGGTVSVYSELGRGTSFVLYLPTADQSDPASVHVTSIAHTGGTERLLVVDDEPAIARFLTRVLEREGYAVTSFEDPVDALEAFLTDPSRFDMVITDLTMPHMTGLELTRRFLALCPDLPVLLCSGYFEATTLERAKQAGVREALSKPVDRAGLLSAVRAHLDVDKY